MNTNKTQTTAASTFTFDFSPVAELMLSQWNAEVTLSDALSCIWNQAPAAERHVSAFRKQFTEFAIGLGYGETWIRRTLAANDELRVRKTSKTMSATKKAKAKGKGPKGPITFTLDRVSEVLADQGFSRADIKAVLAALASK